MGRLAFTHLNQKFGMLTVTKVEIDDNDVTWFICICDCGKLTKKRAADVKKGHTKSCGCFRRNIRRLKDGEASFNILWRRYINNARLRGQEFELTKENFRNLLLGHCHYCGSPPSMTQNTRENTGTFIYNGIDRVDNRKGYIMDNCVSCCEICNKAKRDMTYNEFISWTERLVQYKVGGERWEG